MLKTQIKRTLFLGIINVVRNSFVSFSIILVMIVSLFIIGFSFLFGHVMNDVIEDLRDKVDVTVYFVPDASENQIFEFKDNLGELPQVEEVIYVSQAIALEEYRKRHENDPDILHGLDILGRNPFRARLSIKAQEVGDFESIARFLENEDILSDNPTTIINKIDYYQNREIISRITSVVDTATFFTRFIIILLMFITFVVVFNIMRIIIYLSSEEIKVMRLIGAKDWYVRSPFLVSGGIYGIIGGIIATLLIYPVSFLLSPTVENFFGGKGLIDYYTSEFIVLTLLLLFVGMFVGILSSYLSCRRYLDD